MNFEELRDRLERNLAPEEFGFLIRDSASQKEAARFMSQQGCNYPGQRIESIPLKDLAMDLAEDALKEPALFRETVRWLNDLNQGFIRKVTEIPTPAFAQFPEVVESIYESGTVGRFLWALLLDSRKEAHSVIPKFLEAARKASEKDYKEHSKFQAFWKRVQKGVFRGKDKLEVAQLLRELSQSLREKENQIRKLEKQNHELKERISHLQREESVLRTNFQEAHRGKQLAEQRLREKDQRVADLEESLKKALSQSEMEMARQREELKIRELEKEIKRQAHRLKEVEELAEEIEKRAADEQRKRYELEKEREKLLEEKDSLQKKLNGLELAASQTVQTAEVAGRAKRGPLREKEGRRSAVFLDAKSLFQATRRTGIRLHYKRILETVTEGRKCVKALAFLEFQGKIGTPRPERFIRFLEHAGFEVKVKLSGPLQSPFEFWPLWVAFEILETVERLKIDTVVLIADRLPDKQLVRAIKAKDIALEAASLVFPDSSETESYDFFYNLGQPEFHVVEESPQVLGNL